MAFEKVSKSPVKDRQTVESSSGFTSRPFTPLVKQPTQIPTVQLSNSDRTGQQQEFVNNDFETNRLTTLPEIPIFPPHYNREPQRIQRKLIIGQTGDKYEQEADRVAHQVVQRTPIPSQSVSMSQPKSEFAQRMKGKVLQRSDSSGQIEMQTNKFGLMQEPKVPFIQGEGLNQDQNISQTQPKVIQRITDTEARENLSEDWLEYYDAWLEMRGAESEESLDLLLGPLTIEELKSKLREYEDRQINEDEPEDKWNQFLPDIIPFATVVDNLLANSQDFGEYIQQRQAEGVNSADNVSVLGESDFLEAFVNELKLKYQHDGEVAEFSEEVNNRLNELSSANDNSFDSYFKINVAMLREADTSNGFTSFFGGTNRTIYLRKSTFDNVTETYVHELMHRYSSLNFLQLGASINEGLTDLFMQKLLQSLGFSIVTESYATQVKLVEKLIEIFFDNDSTMFKQAYFQGNTQPVISRISMGLQPEQYDILINGSDVQEQITILQEMDGEQESDEEIEESEIDDLTSEEGEQEADEQIEAEASQTHEPTSEEGEQEADEQIEAEASQTHEPTSEGGEQDADEQIEAPRPAKRKRNEEQDEEDEADIKSLRHSLKHLKRETSKTE
ncbi:hypothetical protein [Nostoc sp. C117]|uniref:hypothetical protein n=1 Tax=Nostoc sp. C117 TaxID=3349875 RepID=UPI00370DBD49